MVDQGTLQGIGTLLALLAFLGVCAWAYSGRKKKDFDEAAQLPFTDESASSDDEKRQDQV